VRSGFDHYTDIQGRASRSAFWYWALFQFAVFVAAEIVGAVIGTPIIYYLAVLALFLPSICVSVRRLQDTNRSGWWILIGIIPIIGWIVLIVFYVQESDPGTNDYGPPMDESGAVAPAAV
jgi:uncharacterized membrane protein YhaH (DUF805 family)